MEGDDDDSKKKEQEGQRAGFLLGSKKHDITNDLNDAYFHLKLSRITENTIQIRSKVWNLQWLPYIPLLQALLSLLVPP